MYTIVLDKYKNLNTTIRTTLFVRENMADKIQFLVPPVYQNNDISEYTVTLKYIDPNGNFHSEILTPNEELYKDYIKYELSVGTRLTQVAGKLVVRLTLVKFDINDGVTEIDKIETNSTVIQIQQPTGFVDNINFEDIEAFKAKMGQMENDINNLQDNMPDDLGINDNDILHLTHDGEPIGNGVEILIPTQFDELDDSKDGIVDVDNINNTPQNSQFIEL